MVTSDPTGSRDSDPTVITADRGRWWAPLLLWAEMCALVGIVLGTISWLLAGDPVEVTVGMSMLCAGAALVGGLPPSLWWLVGPGRTRYAVRGGHLVVERGRRRLRSIPCDRIVSLEIDDPLCWREFLVHRVLSIQPMRSWAAPELWVEATEWDEPRVLVGPRAMPQILLWGEDRLCRADAELREAVEVAKSRSP